MPNPTYDCLVLSGGGATGAYGAGVAKAIHAYRQAKHLETELCYIGTSVGALNAYLLAADGPDRLVSFWRAATNRSVLGTDERPTMLRFVRRGFAKPFSVYDNRSLRRLIAATATLGSLHSPLVITATDYTNGRLAAFYASELFEQIVAEDAKRPARSQRLAHLVRLDSDELLVDALLASAAIPVFFPPVDISFARGSVTQTARFIDGGIGNNTPTREAAYFYRYLEMLNLGIAGTVYCVSQDPPRVVDESGASDIQSIIMRAFEVYHYVHTSPIVDAWTRINREVDDQLAKVNEINAWLEDLVLPSEVRDEVKQRIDETFGRLGGLAPRVSTPLVKIEPSIDLGDFLDFHPRRAEDHIRHGYSDTLKALRQMPVGAPGETGLDEVEYGRLINAALW